jgi:hypothetical protein
VTKKKKSKAPAKRALPVRKKRETESEWLMRTDVDQYNTERMFAAERVARTLLEGSNSTFRFDEDEDDVAFGSCELNGVDDARDEKGCGGAWVCIRVYIPNLDINTEIDS